MPRGKTGTGATVARARSGTTTLFMPLFTIGKYAAFWVGNQLDILEMTGGGLVSIRNQANCTDLWNVFTLYLKEHNVIPVQGQALAAGAPRVRQRASAAVAPITGGNTNSGTIRRTRARRQPPINSTAVGAGSVNSNT